MSVSYKSKFYQNGWFFGTDASIDLLCTATEETEMELGYIL